MTELRSLRAGRLAALALSGAATLAACSDTAVVGKMHPDPGVPTTLEVDLLLVVDDAAPAQDALALFAAEASGLVATLTGPLCVDGGARLVVAPPEGCAAIGKDAVANLSLRVGVISSAVDGGSGSCGALGHLVRGEEQEPLVLQAWRGAPAAGLEAFANAVETRVLRAAEERAAREAEGSFCRHPAPLESLHRFLVEPAPLDGVGELDQTLLADRAAFLRPHSTVLGVVLSTRDDCSIDPAFGELAESSSPLSRARAVCGSNPDDACCAPCGAPVPASCGEDPACEKAPFHTTGSDPPSLRCWEPKRRFGVELRRPLSRYQQAFGVATPWNPLFAEGRSPDDVLVFTLAGVPWQDLGPNAVLEGRDLLHGAPWAALLPEDPSEGDPRMIESRVPRDGLPSPGSSPVAEHGRPDELQYACVFALPEPRDCSPSYAEFADENACACAPGLGPSPLCDADDPWLQVGGSATPAVRLATFARSLGERGGLGSACAMVPSAPSLAGPGLGEGVNGAAAAALVLGAAVR